LFSLGQALKFGCFPAQRAVIVYYLLLQSAVVTIADFLRQP
jgi:hypothetical protein